MEEQLLKIMNILKRFSLGDLSTYLECDISNIALHIDKFECNGIIKKISKNEYLYDNNNLITKNNLKSKQEIVSSKYTFSENQIFNLNDYKNFPAKKVFTKKRDLDYFNNSDDEIKKLIIKNVVLFKLVGNLTKSAAKVYLDNIAKEYPEYKMNAQWYRTKYKRYMKEGLPGLYRNKHCIFDNKAFEEFKKIYLSPKQYTKEQAYEILKMNDNKKDSLPSLATLVHRLNREFSKEEIEKFRTIVTKIGEQQESLIYKKKQPYNILFKTAADRYWEMIVENNTNKEYANTIKRNIKRLKEYFNEYKTKDITYEKIVKYKTHLTSEGVNFSTMKSILSSLLIILRLSGCSIKYDIYENLTYSATIYSLSEIKKLIEKDGPEIWVIALGVKLAELQALEYEEIDYSQGVLNINKYYRFDNIVILHKNQAQRRELIIPQYLLNKIDKTKKGFIFGKIQMPNYESCLYAHIMLLHKQNVSMNVIAKNLGYNSIQNFYRQFYHLFPQKLENNFDILKPLGFI